MRLTRREFLKSVVGFSFALALFPPEQDAQARISDLDNPCQFPIAFPLYFEEPDPPATRIYLPLFSQH